MKKRMLLRIRFFDKYAYYIETIGEYMSFINNIRTYGYLSIFKEGDLAANVHFPFFFAGVAIITETLFIILLF